jgi:isocitrate lyase
MVVGRNVGVQGSQASLGLKRRQAKQVLRVDLHQQGVDLIPESRSIEESLVAFIREEIKDDRVVVSRHDGQAGRLLTHHESYRAGIE